jgi:PAS domain S-box-containing protein
MDKNPSTILIIDDEPAMREALGELLAEEGYYLSFAQSGEEGLAKAAETVPDLILLDVVMPDLDGFAVCRKLRADELLAEVPIIITTSLADRDSRLRGFAAGADDYVTKPVDEPELLARVRTTTRLNRYRRLLEEQIGREMAEEALDISETRYHSLFGSVPVGLYRSTPDGQILEANPTLVEMLDYPDLETLLATKTTDGYIDLQDRRRWQAMIQQKGIVLGFETQWRRYDGTTIWVRENSRVVRDEKGQVLYYEGAVEDITERKRAEEALQKREAHQALVLGSLPMAFYTAQPFGDYGGTWVSDQIEQIVGFPTEQFLEDTHLWAARLHPEDRDRAFDAFGKLPDTETLEIEYRWQAADGKYVWLLDHAVLVRDGDGKPQEIIGTWLDITERKQAEEALQDSLQKAAHGQALLLALSKAAQTVQRARSPQEVYQTIGEEIAKLGYRATIFDLTEDEKYLTVGHMTFESKLVKAAEKLVGLSSQDYRVRLTPGGFYEHLISEGEPVFSDPGGAPLAEALPKAARPLADKLAGLLGIHQSIYVPLKIGDRTPALLVVRGADLAEGDIPAMTAFANQAAIAVTNAQLYQAANQERDKAQQYLDIAGVMLVAIDAEGKITLINRKGCEILGCEEDKILGQNWFDSCLPSEINDSVKSVFDQLIAGEVEPVEYYENPVVTKSGEERLIAWHNTVLRDEAGNIAGTLSSGEDITERAQAEEALRESEENYRSVVDNANVGIVVIQEGKQVFYNPRHIELLGYSDKEFKQVDLATLIHPDERELALNRIRRRLTGDETDPEGLEIRLITKSGETRWVQATSSVISWEGKPAIQAFIADITKRIRSEQERTQAEEALRQSEETARALLNATNDLAILIAPGGAILASNEMVARAAGIDVDEMIGASIEDFLSPDLLEIGTARANQVQSSGEAIRFQAEREGATLDISIYPVFDAQGELARFAVFARDITEQIKTRQAIEQRSRELAALNEIGQAVISTLDLQEMLTLIAEHTNQLMGMAATSIVLREEADDGLYFAAASGEGADAIVGQRLAIDQGIAGWVIQHGKPVLIPDVSKDARWYGSLDAQTGFSTRSLLCVPLKSKERTIGALEALNKPDGFTQADLHLLSTLAAPVATAIENARLFKEVRVGREQLQSLSRRLVEMQEAERAHVARELHDETGQALSGMLLSLSLLEQEADQPKAVKDRTSELLVLVDDMLENLHRLAMNLRPATLDHLGLLPTLEQYVETFEEQYNIETQFEIVGLGSDRLPPEMETALYRIVQESLTNVARHAQATRVDVLVARRDDQVVTIVEDNGSGFDPESAMQTSRLGLLGMRERAEMLNGRLVIESVPGSGTTVLVEVPYQIA